MIARATLAHVDGIPRLADATLPERGGDGPICVDASALGQRIGGTMFEELWRLLPGREGLLFTEASNETSLRAQGKMVMRRTAEYIYDGRQFLLFAYAVPLRVMK